jgi:hypothetical protein
MPGDPSSTIGNRLGLIAIELAIIVAPWYYLGLPHVLAAGLAVILVVSGVLPDRWSALVGGVMLIAGAGAIWVVYPGNRNMAMFIAAVGVVFAIVGAGRWRTAR